MGGFDKVDAPFAENAFRIEKWLGYGGARMRRWRPWRRSARCSSGTRRSANTGNAPVNARAPQDIAGCANIKTQRIIAHPDLNKSVVVDEEQGITLLWMNFGDTGTYGAGNALVIFEAFKVFGGEMHAVQAFMKVLPKDTQRGWGKTLKGAE